MITALLLPVLLAMVGMGIDIGTYSSHRRSLQNAADGAALAGGQELPDSGAATSKAMEYAQEHGIDPADVSVTVTGGTTEPRVRVVIDETHEFSFMQIVGFDNRDVGAVAAAGKFSFGAGEGVVPWSIEEPFLESITSGDEVIIKYDSAGPAPGQGNFGAIRIDGSGGSDYEYSSKYGAQDAVCSVVTLNCTADSCPGGSCPEDSDQCDGPECTPKTGNMVGPTKDAVDFRIDYTSSGCDSFDEAFSPDPDASGYYVIDPNCNPWSGGGCATQTSICSRRIFLIPVIDGFGSGSSEDAEIQSFAMVFLEGYDGSCSGNSCDIRARFVRVQMTVNFSGGTFSENGYNQFVKLVE
jgi:Flp pilus assembly protein TadG